MEKKVLSVYAMMFVANLSIKDKGKWNKYSTARNH